MDSPAASTSALASGDDLSRMLPAASLPASDPIAAAQGTCMDSPAAAPTSAPASDGEDLSRMLLPAASGALPASDSPAAPSAPALGDDDDDDEDEGAAHVGQVDSAAAPQAPNTFITFDPVD